MLKRFILKIVLVCLIVGCCCDRNPDMQNDTVLVDARDGQQYRIVRIDNRVWMAENLNYGKVVKDCNQQDNGIVEKTLYNNDTTIASVFGGFYTWDEAMNYQHSDSGDICPTGWHIPSLQEWRQLRRFLGKENAGQKLKASKSDSIAWDGINSTGFTAIPSGVAYRRYFARKGHWAVYWSSTAHDSAYSWFAQLDGFWYPQPPRYKTLYLGNYYRKENAFCIRCIKNREK